MSGNPYLEGNFAPVAEEISEHELQVEGNIPPELEGRYIRTGPNPYGEVDVEKHHWFIGDGMLHGVELNSGKANWYRNRYVQSEKISQAKGIDPLPTLKGGMFDGSGNTNVVHHAGKILAINELSLPYELDRELNSVARTMFGGVLPVGTFAHPKFDTKTGDMYLLGYQMFEPYLYMHVINKQGQMTRTLEIPVAGPVMIHDFAITENYVLIFDLPVVFSMQAVEQGLPLPYRWDSEYTPRLGIIPKTGGIEDMQWIEVESCYIFHPLNAYEDNGNIVMDFIRHENQFSASDQGPAGLAPTLNRWIVDLKKGSVNNSTLHELGQEFPRADERLMGLKHRYGYCAGFKPGDNGATVLGSQLYKHDLQTGSTQTLDLGAHYQLGEFVFVPADDKSAEDEGYLMGYAYDTSRDKSDLLILDANNFSNQPIARIKLPQRVPFGFHGNWIADRDLAR